MNLYFSRNSQKIKNLKNITTSTVYASQEGEGLQLRSDAGYILLFSGFIGGPLLIVLLFTSMTWIHDKFQ